jgi:hypothetical protein
MPKTRKRRRRAHAWKFVLHIRGVTRGFRDDDRMTVSIDKEACNNKCEEVAVAIRVPR